MDLLVMLFFLLIALNTLSVIIGIYVFNKILKLEKKLKNEDMVLAEIKVGK